MLLGILKCTLVVTMFVLFCLSVIIIVVAIVQAIKRRGKK